MSRLLALHMAMVVLSVVRLLVLMVAGLVCPGAGETGGNWTGNFTPRPLLPGGVLQEEGTTSWPWPQTSSGSPATEGAAASTSSLEWSLASTGRTPPSMAPPTGVSCSWRGQVDINHSAALGANDSRADANQTDNNQTDDSQIGATERYKDCREQSQTENPASSTRPSTTTRSLLDSGSLTRAQYAEGNEAVTYLSLPLAFTGVILNSLTAATYLQPHMRSACSTLLVALTLAQLLYVVLMFSPLVMALVYGARGTQELPYLISALYLSNFMLSSLRRIAFVMTLVVSCERCVAVVFPLKSKQWRLSRHSALVSGLVFALTLAVNLPSAFKYVIVAQGGDKYTFRQTDWWTRNEDAMEGLAVAMRALFVYIPLFATLLVNVATTAALHRHRRQASAMQSTKDLGRTGKADAQMTLAILVSTLVFVLLSLPTHIMSIFNDYFPDFGFGKREHYLYLLLVRVFSALETLSNCTDVLAYLVLSQRFRRTFLRLLCCACCRAKGGNSGSRGSSSSKSNASTPTGQTVAT